METMNRICAWISLPIITAMIFFLGYAAGYLLNAFREEIEGWLEERKLFPKGTIKLYPFKGSLSLEVDTSVNLSLLPCFKKGLMKVSGMKWERTLEGYRVDVTFETHSPQQVKTFGDYEYTQGKFEENPPPKDPPVWEIVDDRGDVVTTISSFECKEPALAWFMMGNHFVKPSIDRSYSIRERKQPTSPPPPPIPKGYYATYNGE